MTDIYIEKLNDLTYDLGADVEGLQRSLNDLDVFIAHAKKESHDNGYRAGWDAAVKEWSKHLK